MINIDDIIKDALTGNNETSQHGITLLALACSIRAKNILETGVRRGGTTYPLLRACQILNAHLVSIDIANPMFVPPEELRQYWTFHKEDALQYIKNLTICPDLIYIDDWHTSEHVYNELTAIKNLVTKNTLITTHDLMHTFAHPNYNTAVINHGEFQGTGPYGGVIKFINENPEFEFVTIPVNHGLTILRRGN